MLPLYLRENDGRGVVLEQNTACISCFRDGKDAPAKEEYTRVWIMLINQMEQAEAVLSEL